MTKPFSWEAYKAGAKVVTREGDVVCGPLFMTDDGSSHPIIGKIDKDYFPLCWTAQGLRLEGMEQHEDLMLSTPPVYRTIRPEEMPEVFIVSEAGRHNVWVPYLRMSQAANDQHRDRNNHWSPDGKIWHSFSVLAE